MAGTDATRSMTYAELAAALGIGDKSCRNLVRRKGWRRRPGNDGVARIDVPIEALERDTSTNTSIRAPISAPTHAAPHVPTETVEEIAALRAEIATLQTAVARAEAIAAERGASLERERKRADEVQAKLDAVIDRLLAAQEAAARPWWRRLVG